MKNATGACEEENADYGALRYVLRTYENVVEEGAGGQGVAVVGRKFWSA